MTGQFVIRGWAAVTVSVLGRVMLAWLAVGATPPADIPAPLTAGIDYLIVGITLITVAATGWWAGTRAQAALTRWIDRRFAGGLLRWRDRPRSRWSDALYVNSVMVFALRMANVVVRPVWRRSIGLSAAVVLIELTWNAGQAATVLARAGSQGQVVAATGTLARHYAGAAAYAALAGCVVLIGNVLLIAGRSIATLGPRGPRRP